MLLCRLCVPESSNHGKFKLSDWMIAKPFLLGLEWTLMILTVFLGRSAFLAHVFVVTYLLLIVLYKINQLYGKIGNPHYLFFVAVMGGGVAHMFIPVVGHFFHNAMFAHLGMCFMVHVLHLSQCYTVFNDITFKDTEFITILWTVNIAEMVVNIAFVLDDVFSEQHYIACALAVQTMALMIVNLNLKIGGGSGTQENSTNSTLAVTNASSSLFDVIIAMVNNFISFIDRWLVSRVVLMLISSIAVASMELFPDYRYLIFMITLSIIMRLAVRKVDHICPLPSVTYLLDKALMVAPVVMIGFALVTELGVLSHSIGVVFTLVTLIWGLGLMFFALFTITDGQCTTVPIAFLILITAGTTSVIYLLQGEPTQEMQLFASLSVSTSVLFFLSKIQVSDFRGTKVHPVAPNSAAFNKSRKQNPHSQKNHSHSHLEKAASFRSSEGVSVANDLI